MLYFSFFELIRAVAASFLYGAFFGIVYSALKVACGLWESIAAMPKKAIELSVCYSFSRIKESFWQQNSKKTGIIYHVKDFLFTFFFGAFFSVLLYVTLDGVFRPFMALVAIIAAFVINLTIGRALERVCLFIFRLAYIVLLTLFTLLLIPPRRLVNKIISRANK